MFPLTWRFAAIAGTVCVALSTVAGEITAKDLTLKIIFQATALLAIVCMIQGIKRHQPARKSPWIGFAISAACFFTSYGMRLIDNSMLPRTDGSPTLSEFVDAAGYLSAIISVHLLGHIRDKDKDPTTIIDSLILTGGVATLIWASAILPYARDTELTVSGRVFGVVLAVLSIALAFGAVRLIIGPSNKSTTSKLLTAAAVFAMLSEVVATVVAKGAVDPLVIAFGALALTYLGAGALHPSMLKSTEPASIGISSMTHKRQLAMLTSLLLSPCLIITNIVGGKPDSTYVVGLFVAWVCITGLVMVRLAGLVRVGEDIAQVERALNRAAAALVSATDRTTTYHSAITAMNEIVGSETPGLRTSVTLSIGKQWRVVDAQGKGAELAKGRVLDAEVMQTLIMSSAPHPVSLHNTHAVDNPTAGQCSVVIAALTSRDGPTYQATIDTSVPTRGTGIRGALIIATDKPLASIVVDALGSLASDVSLAIEAIGLAEDLHRRRSERQFTALVKHSSDLTVVLNQAGLITYATPAAKTLLGRSPESLIGLDIGKIIHPEDRTNIHKMINMLGNSQSISRNVELRMKSDFNNWKTLDVTLTDLRHDESVKGIVMNGHDITERKALEHDLRHKVLHDDLTGIANRVLFRDRVGHALASQKVRGNTVSAVLFIDIDDFKIVNDGLGHDTGDELLKVIAFRLESFARSGDTAARLGGDEFGVLLEGLFTTEDALNAAHRLLEVVNQPVDFDGREIAVTASVGIAIAIEEVSAEVLVRNADVAMYHAKQTGKNRVKLFDQAMSTSAFERLELKGDLTHALEREELHLNYQPLIDMESGELVGFEALMRWTHPKRGMVSPGSFIPLAEETGLIVPIGAWALIEAMSQVKAWNTRHHTAVGISINVSPRQLQEVEIVSQVQAALFEADIDPALVTLELTESAGLDDATRRDRLIALRNLGCQIAADDFGTGFASYAALQQLPFTNVKIDRSLIIGLSENDERAEAQVRSIIEMGHALGLTITAEGIEDSRQLDALKAMGADKGQGYLFGKPTNAADAEEWVRKLDTLAHEDH